MTAALPHARPSAPRQRARVVSERAAHALAILVRRARPNGLVTLGVPGRTDHGVDVRTGDVMAGIDELLAADWIDLARGVVRSRGEIVLDVSQWMPGTTERA